MSYSDDRFDDYGEERDIAAREAIAHRLTYEIEAQARYRTQARRSRRRRGGLRSGGLHRRRRRRVP